MSDTDTRVPFASTAMATGTGLQKTPHQTFNEWLEGILLMSMIDFTNLVSELASWLR